MLHQLLYDDIHDHYYAVTARVLMSVLHEADLPSHKLASDVQAIHMHRAVKLLGSCQSCRCASQLLSLGDKSWG